MPRTGQKYGLVINWWVDERRDPVKSTRAAARYLKDLYALFRSWHLAQAGYNAGEAKILTGLSRVRGKTFWSLAGSRHIPSETRNFVPKLIAATMIAKDPEAYGFVDLRIQEPIQLELVHVPRSTELRFIAKASGIPLEELRDLNLDLRRGVTPPNYPDYHLKVPNGTGTRVAAALRGLKAPSARAERYLVQPGDTLGKIASAFGTTVEALVTLNAILDPGRIQTGREILLPSSSPRPPGSPPAANVDAHVVREGETLWGIARRYGLPVADLLRMNDLNPEEPIRPGDRILLRVSEPVALP
jgi:membrane-bound lytic murein transglycosylase D